MEYKVLLFDLDGTLLRDDKTISPYTLDIIHKCKEKGFLIGFATSRSEKNSLKFISDIAPDILISSGGALLRFRSEILYSACFTVEETNKFIYAIKKICGTECGITVDTLTEHYLNYPLSPEELKDGWSNSIFTDFVTFQQEALKICAEIHDSDIANRMKNLFPNYDCVRFSGTDWYKFTHKCVTKEKAIIKLCEYSNISLESIIAFGDDLVDIGMLKQCGLGVAMGNAISEVKAIANEIIETNENNGIARYLAEKFEI
ncbi:MAG: HAD family hydrolase [Acutalibacteraceae bacterium]